MSAPRARPVIEEMAGYTPGEQPAPGERFVKLNTNENPFPPSPRVMEAIAAVEAERLRRYPPPLSDSFRRVAARLHGVTPEAILAGNGSDDLLQVALRTFCGPGDVLAYPDPTYSLYPVLAKVSEVKVATVAWEHDWRLPVEALLATGARAIFFANPNSPSGTSVPPEVVATLAKRSDALVVVDEAYVDFADTNCLELLGQHENVLITRTLSKGYSLAGLRFGYAIGAAAVIAEMTKVKDSYNCDAVSIAAACAAIEDRAHAQATWDAVKRERTRMTAELVDRGFSVVPSQSNFLLATMPGGCSAHAAHLALKHEGVLVRFFDKPGLDDKLRLSIGTPEENAVLLSALDRVLAREAGRV